MYNITNEKILEINFDAHFKNIINENLINEFFSNPSKEHYRLLAYMSTLFNNSIILDIGTHTGGSALALSYNPTNLIFSFDIYDKVISNIRNVKNINFFNDNLFEHPTMAFWKSVIMSSKFIFLDVDPHNGCMEYDFVMMLKQWDYKGFIICDDVWYFQPMRNNFWYKIDNKFKYDLTQYGHFSGTGVVTFNEGISFNKNDNSNWTLVTAYFDLTKYSDASNEIKTRDFNYYLSHATSTLSLPYNLVIFCDNESYDAIKLHRPSYLNDKTQYVICNFDEFYFFNQIGDTDVNKDGNNTFASYRDIIKNNRINHPYFFDSRNTPSYYLFCMSRYIMLKKVILENKFKSSHFCWINFCIERMGFKNLIHLDEAMALKRNKFSTCYIDYVPEELVKNTKEYFQLGRCGMCSGFFTGNAEYMYKVCDLIENKFIEYAKLGYGHADEQLYSPVYFENKDLFEHYYGDYLQMITNYAFIYDAPENPIRNFIRHSFVYKNYTKCIEACNILLESHKLGKCDLSNDNINFVNNIVTESNNFM